jgi:hypothetical protein
MRESFIILIYVDILIILVLWNLIRDDMGWMCKRRSILTNMISSKVQDCLVYKNNNKIMFYLEIITNMH